MNSFKKGDLAFIPSDLTLLQFADKTSVKKFIKTKAPSSAMIVENETHSPYCSILYNGERWYVPKIDIYPIPGGKGDG
jgi:hypothetical protein